MKRFSALILAGVLLLTLAACGGGQEDRTMTSPPYGTYEIQQEGLILQVKQDGGVHPAGMPENPGTVFRLDLKFTVTLV